MTIVVHELKNPKPLCRVISVRDTNLVFNKMNGAEIYSEDFVEQNLLIEFENVKATNNGQVGIFAARMAIYDLRIVGCKVMNNKGKGCILKVIHQRENKNTFVVKDSKFSENKDIGLQIDDTGLNILDVQ